MEPILQMTGLCVVAAVLSVTVKRGSPETALLVSVAAAVAVLLFLGNALGELLCFLRTLGEHSGLDGALFVPVYKTAAIALVVRVGGGLCRDAGDSALAGLVEMAGAVCALLAALPLLQTALSMLEGLMR